MSSLSAKSSKRENDLFDDEKNEGFLVFQDEKGDDYCLYERSVREIFCKRGISLVFLNACNSGTGGRSEFNKGVAQAMVAHGLPAMVANQYSVLDTSATSFAQYFYWAIARGMSIGQAACEARISVNYSMQGEPIDWAIPVVYARDPNMTLSIPSNDARMTPLNSIVTTGKHVRTQTKKRIMVWDIDSCFPKLEETLDILTASQDVFGFELTAMSSPVDVWDMELESSDGTPYLVAEKMERRLRPSMLDFQADMLICITRHWLRDNQVKNLYSWWGDKNHRVLIISVARFPEMSAEGIETNRMIANMIVAVLAGALSGLGSHEWENNCPMFYNPSRDFGYLINPQQFDDKCTAVLKEKIPKEFPSLEKLLKVF